MLHEKQLVKKISEKEKGMIKKKGKKLVKFTLRTKAFSISIILQTKSTHSQRSNHFLILYFVLF